MLATRSSKLIGSLHVLYVHKQDEYVPSQYDYNMNSICVSHEYRGDNMELIKRKLEIFLGAIKGDYIGYFFGRSRPPKQIDEVSGMYLPWRFATLQEVGWGPPTCMAIRDNVQD
jgi:hypothetical protein